MNAEERLRAALAQALNNSHQTGLDDGRVVTLPPDVYTELYRAARNLLSTLEDARYAESEQN